MNSKRFEIINENDVTETLFYSGEVDMDAEIMGSESAVIDKNLLNMEEKMMNLNHSFNSIDEEMLNLKSKINQVEDLHLRMQFMLTEIRSLIK